MAMDTKLTTRSDTERQSQRPLNESVKYGRYTVPSLYFSDIQAKEGLIISIISTAVVTVTDFYGGATTVSQPF